MTFRLDARCGMALWLGVLASAGAEEAPKPAEPAPTFAVLRIERGSDVSFRECPSGAVEAESRKIAAKAKAELTAWEAKRNAYLKSKSNDGKPFPDPKPAPAAVSVAQDGIVSQEEAKRLAAAALESWLGPFLVVRIAGCEGAVRFEVLRERKLPQRQTALQDEYVKACESWQEKNAAQQQGKGKAPPPAMPAQPSATVVKRGLHSQAEADAAMAELQKAEKKK